MESDPKYKRYLMGSFNFDLVRVTILLKTVYFDKKHDHIVMTDTGEVVEFTDPRIENIKKTIEEVFDITIDKHSLYFYATKSSAE